MGVPFVSYVGVRRTSQTRCALPQKGHYLHAGPAPTYTTRIARDPDFPQGIFIGKAESNGPVGSNEHFIW